MDFKKLDELRKKYRGEGKHKDGAPPGNQNAAGPHNMGYSSAEDALKAFSSGKKSVDCKDLRNLSKEDRHRVLDEAPSGSKITGVVSKSGPYAGTPVVIEKTGGYGMAHGTLGGGTSKNYSNDWYIGGSKALTPRKTIREILEGSNKYYELKK